MASLKEKQDVISYIKQQASDVFTGGDSLLGFALDIHKALLANEAKPEIAYQLSFANPKLDSKNTSSFSFGAVQWDIGSFAAFYNASTTNLKVETDDVFHTTSFGMQMLVQILAHATDADGNQIATRGDIQLIVDALGVDGRNAIDNPAALGSVLVDPVTGDESLPLLDLINEALNSDYGKQQINLWHHLGRRAPTALVSMGAKRITSITPTAAGTNSGAAPMGSMATSLRTSTAPI